MTTKTYVLREGDSVSQSLYVTVGPESPIDTSCCPLCVFQWYQTNGTGIRLNICASEMRFQIPMLSHNLADYSCVID